MKEERKQRLIYFAQKHLGKPYKYEATLSEVPKVFDCSSFIHYLYKRIGIDLPRTALDQASIGKTVSRKKSLQPGDLIFIKGSYGHYNPEFPQGIGHVGMYTDNGKIIHAKWEQGKNGSDGGKVRKDNVKKLLYRKDLVIIKRIL